MNEMMNQASNMFDLCRLCATKTAGLQRLHIFDNEGKYRNMSEKISSCLTIGVTETDYLPKFLCVDCVNKVESYYDFKMISLKTDAFLQDLVSKQILPLPHMPVATPVYNNENRDDLNYALGEEHQQELTRKEVLNMDTSEDIVCEPSLYMKNAENNENLSEEAKKARLQLQELKDKPAESSTMPLFRCHYCKVLFPTRKESLEHLKLMHKKIHKCDVCGECFRSLEALGTHKEKYLQQLKDKEEKMETRKSKFKDKGTKKESKKCKICGKEYARNRELHLHERSHTGEKPFACTYCEKSFASTSARNKHIQVHEKRWSHVCSYCGKGFVDKIHFVYHVQKHHTGERPFPCTQCDKKFVRKQDLHMHEVNMHSTKPKVCYKCETCNKTYTTMSYLKQHKKIHELPLESRKIFKCNICEAVFLRNNNLKQHTLVHTGELPFECDICKKRFSSKIGLKIHLLIHSGVKKFVCEVCGKAFALRNSLVCHRRTHTGERPYQCDICHQQFTQKSSLNTHRKRHVRDEVPINWHPNQ